MMMFYDVQQINDWYFVFHQSQKVKTNRASYQAINERVVDVKNKITELADRYQSFHSIIPLNTYPNYCTT
jgi:hypothetical protein